MIRPAHRALTALAAALLTATGLAIGVPAAGASTNTIYVDASGLDEPGCGSGAGHACASIGYALGLAQPDDTISVAKGTYPEDVTVTTPVTMIGHGATVAGSLDLGDISGDVDLSGFDFAPTTLSPAVTVHDAVAGHKIDLHNNTFAGSGATVVAVADNSADLTLDANVITGGTDGLEVAGIDPATATPAYTITGNTFTTGSGAAVALTADSPAVLDANVSGNGGTVAAGAHAITRTGDGVAVTVAATNTITTADGTHITAAPTSVTTRQGHSAQFMATVSSAVALTSAQVDVGLAGTGITTDNATLRYSTNGTVFNDVPLSGGTGALSGTLPSGDGVPAATSVPVSFELDAPVGTVTVTVSLDELVGTSVLNTPATVDVPVTVVANSPPVAQDLNLTTPRNQPLELTLAATDPDGDPLTYSHGDPTSGALTGTGADLTFTPQAATSGPVTFTYTASDDKGATSSPATVTITVGANQAPVATAPGQVAVPFDTATPIALTGSDPDGDALTYTLADAMHGSLDLTTGPLPAGGVTATFTPADGYSGSASFSYAVSDGTSADTVTVALTVGDGPPFATAPTHVAVPFRASSGDIVLTAGNAAGRDLTYTLTAPANGTLNTQTLTGPLPAAGLTVRYTPTGRFSGTDAFTFTVTAGTQSDTAIVYLDVAADTAPVATSFAVPDVVPYASSGVAIPLAGQATDADSDSLTYRVSGAASKGTVSVTGTTATYVPPSNVDATDGTDSFAFSAFDGTTWSQWATVTLRNDRKPIFTTDSQSSSVPHNTGTGAAASTTIVMATTDPDGDQLTYSAPAQGQLGYPAKGSVLQTQPTELSYTPAVGAFGDDTLAYTVTDSNGATVTREVTVHITDQAPTITGPASTSIDFNAGPTTIDGLALTDPDGDTVTIEKTDPTATKGAVAINSSGTSVTYEPNTGATGADSFTIWAWDGHLPSAHALTVKVVIDTPPVAVDPSTKRVRVGGAVTFLLKANDADNDTATFSVNQPAHGKAMLGTDSVTYTAPTNWAGSTSFAFTADDGHGGTGTGTVHVIVTKAIASIGAVTVTPTRPTSAQQPTVVVPVASVGNETNGKVTVHLGAAGYSGKVSHGKAVIVLPAQAGGKHTITATFSGTATTRAVTQPVSKTFSVTRVASAIKYTTDPLALTTTTSNAVAIVHVSTNSLRATSGKITITEAGVGRLASGTISGGVARLSLPRFSIGQHNLTVSYGGTAYIAPSSVVEVERVSLGT